MTPRDGTDFVPGAAFPRDPGNLVQSAGPRSSTRGIALRRRSTTMCLPGKRLGDLARAGSLNRSILFRAAVGFHRQFDRYQRPVLFQSTAQPCARRESHFAALESQHRLSQPIGLRAASLRHLWRSGSKLNLWPRTQQRGFLRHEEHTSDGTTESAIARRVLQYFQPSELRPAGAHHYSGIRGQRKSGSPQVVPNPAAHVNGDITQPLLPMGLITQTPDVAQTKPGLGGGGPRVIQLAAKFTF